MTVYASSKIYVKNFTLGEILRFMFWMIKIILK
jgi:hypothetical protein